MNDKLGCELDAAVHKALWPKHSIYAGYEGTWWCGVRDGLLGYVKYGERLPHYTTDLSAWDGVGDDRGWHWYADEHYDKVHVRLYDGGPLDEVEMFEAVALGVEIPNRFAAQALARSRCVLQRAGVQ